MAPKLDQYISLTAAFFLTLADMGYLRWLSHYIEPFADYLVGFFPHCFPERWMAPA